MSVWLTLFLAIFGTIGFFFTLYAGVLGLLEGKKAKDKPRLFIGSGSKPGTFTYWITWNTSSFALQVYRLRVSLFNPYGEKKEAVFTVTHDPVQKAPFAQEVEFPPAFQEILNKEKADVLITFDFRTVEETTLALNFSIKKVRQIAQGSGAKVPAGLTKLADAKADVAPVMTLDFDELTVRRKKIRDLEAAAKAKAAKAPPPPAKPPTPAAETPTPPPAQGAVAAAVPSIKAVMEQEKKSAVKEG